MKFGLLLATNLNDQSLNTLVPIGLGCITAALNRDLPEIEVILKENPDDLISEQPDIIGISATTEYYYIATQWAAKFKEALDVPIIIGGVHISLLPESMTKDFDVAVIGEGDVTIIELFQSILNNKGINYDELRNIPGLFFRHKDQSYLTPQRTLVQDLDTLPRIQRNILPFYIWYQAHIVSARGCPYKCAFCASQKFSRQHRYYSAERIAQEIEYFVVENGLKDITFYDDLLIANKQRLSSLIEKLDERGILGKCIFHCQVRANLINEEICELMKKLNITTTGIGIESFSDNILRYYNKTGITGETNQKAIDLLSSYGIKVNPSIIFGAPFETREDMLTTLRAIYQNCANGKLGSPAWTLLRPYPGTIIWDYAEKRGLVSRTMDWSLFAQWGTYDMYLCEQVSKDEFREIIDEWRTKISLLRFDTIKSTGGNFVFDQRRDLYEKTPRVKEIIIQRQATGCEADLGDESVLATSSPTDTPGLLINGWHEKDPDGTLWITEKARIVLPTNGGSNLRLWMYIPPLIFSEVYDGTISITVEEEEVILLCRQYQFHQFQEGLIPLEIKIDQEKEFLLLTISSDKSFVPSAIDHNSQDIRKLALVIVTLEII
jgi:radical SAM superfamily enzyme YgiQ (UPF0313 family)